MASILLKSITVGGERKDILIAGSRIVKIAPEGSCIDWDLAGDVEVMECSGKWALPGGWQDYDRTVRENAVKEVLEEAGMTVRPTRLIALHDYHRHNEFKVRFPYNICKAFVLCEYVSGEFQPNIETLGCGFFAPDEIPEALATGKTTKEQIEMCFRAAADAHWPVEFD